MTDRLTVTVCLEVEVDEAAWERTYGLSYDEASAQRQRALIADVEDYVFTAIAESGAFEDGAITRVDLAPGRGVAA